MSDETLRAVIVAAIAWAPALIASVTAAFLAWKGAQASKAANDQSTRNAHTLEQVRSATSLNTDRTGTLTFSVNDLQKKLAEMQKS